MERYNALVIDTVNLAYRAKAKPEEDSILTLGGKPAYKETACNFINYIESLKRDYLHYDGEVYLLIDNYFSRADLQSSFLFADRKQLDEAYKATRKKANKEFYNTVNLLRYYYIVGPKSYHTIRIDNLEADDLVKPLLSGKLKDKRCLLVTTDLDWCRYLGPNVDWIPDFARGPETAEEVSRDLGFKISEKNLVIYKAFFGDSSDNIPAISRSTASNIEQVKKLMDMAEYYEQLILFSRDEDKVREYSILEDIHKDEKRFIVNIQLISTIPCAESHIDSVCTEGRDAETLYKVIREALGLDKSAPKFVFGDIKRPRK